MLFSLKNCLTSRHALLYKLNDFFKFWLSCELDVSIERAEDPCELDDEGLECAVDDPCEELDEEDIDFGEYDPCEHDKGWDCTDDEPCKLDESLDCTNNDVEEQGTKIGDFEVVRTEIGAIDNPCEFEEGLNCADDPCEFEEGLNCADDLAGGFFELVIVDFSVFAEFLTCFW